ncbi:MAG: hypothetical protein O7G88_11635 [bacterium]|nr:hypothetical protein [bacterium]
MYVERTNYWAQPGKTQQVLAVRRRASQIRTGLGLPAGIIFVKAGGQDEGPDVQWECTFDTLDERATDLQIRHSSSDFRQIREAMREVSKRFERHLVLRDSATTAA